MVTLKLSTPLAIASAELATLTVRPPGRRLFLAMVKSRVAGGFTDADTARFAARLTGRSAITIRRLAEADFAAVRAAVEREYQSPPLRLGASFRISEAARQRGGGRF